MTPVEVSVAGDMKTPYCGPGDEPGEPNRRPALRRVIPEALDTVERVMTAEFWREATAAPERAVEVPFAVRLEEAGTTPRLLHGVIDLATQRLHGFHAHIK